MYQSQKNTAPVQRNELPTDVDTTIPGQPSVLPVILHSHGIDGPFIVDLPIKDGDFP